MKLKCDILVSKFCVQIQLVPLQPGGAAEATELIAPGDVLVRCTATTLQDSDVPITLGDGPPPRTKSRQIPFSCLGENFDTVMTALNSTGIVDTGFKHSKAGSTRIGDIPKKKKRPHKAWL